MKAGSTANSDGGALVIRRTLREELVAELRAAFLSANLAITPNPREDHAACGALAQGTRG
jgi:antirestriction protein ArdC